MTPVRCSVCATLFGLDEELCTVLRRSGNTFVCPMGHKQAFTGLSPEAARIAELERVIVRREQEIRDKEWWRCAWCGKRVRVYSIEAHLRRHGFPGVRAFRAAQKQKQGSR